MVDVLN